MSMIVLENVVGGEGGKEAIRQTFPSNTNYPIVCRNPNCYFPLEILHTDPISESAYFENGVSRRGKPSSVICPKCETEHDLEQYLRFNDTDEIPSEARITLEKMPTQLRQGITKFPKK